MNTKHEKQITISTLVKKLQYLRSNPDITESKLDLIVQQLTSLNETLALSETEVFTTVSTKKK
jgi:hypothetical protein